LVDGIGDVEVRPIALQTVQSYLDLVSHSNGISSRLLVNARHDAVTTVESTRRPHFLEIIVDGRYILDVNRVATKSGQRHLTDLVDARELTGSTKRLQLIRLTDAACRYINVLGLDGIRDLLHGDAI
jgi:hypothetical protein